MRNFTGTGESPCALGCNHGLDRIEHYAVCERAWRFLGRPKPGGLHISDKHRTIQGFFALDKGMDEDTKVRTAIGIYAVARTVHCCKVSGDLDPQPLLRLFAKSVS